MALRSGLSLGSRSALLLVAGGTSVDALWRVCREPADILVGGLLADGPHALSRMSFEQVLTGGCATTLLGCALWLLAVTWLAVAGQAARALGRGSRMRPPLDALTSLSERSCPALVRALVTTALGVTVTTALAAPAPADPGGGEPVGLTGLALPDRTLGAPADPSAPRTPPPRRTGIVVVRTGDSLWSIAAALLPTDASDADVGVGWRRLYRANATRIGADPDLIVAGTSLVVPRLTASRRKDHP